MIIYSAKEQLSMGRDSLVQIMVDLEMVGDLVNIQEKATKAVASTMRQLEGLNLHCEGQSKSHYL